MSEQVVLYEVANHIATIVINRPERRNALSRETLTGLLQTFEDAGRDPDVRAVILTGSGDRAFCAGADLGDDLAANAEGARQPERGPVPRLFTAMYLLGKPTIAKVRGYALAGGFGLALACDFVFAADNAVFGAPEINVGMWPMMITVPMLRSMPPKLVLELQLTGRRVSADEGRALGFVREVVSAGQLDAAVTDFAAQLALRSPAIVRLGLNAFYETLDLTTQDALDHLEEGLAAVMRTADHKEGVSAFREKRDPVWTGR